MRRLIILFIINVLLLIGFNLYGQTSAPYRDALRYVNQGDYKNAVTSFQNALNLNPKHADAWYYLGLTYGRLEMHQEAVFSFKNLENVNPNYDPSFYKETVDAMLKLGQFDEAKTYVNKYRSFVQKGAKHTDKQHWASNRIEYINKSPALRTGPKNTSDPVVVGPVNSVSNDYMPQVNPTGTRLYFTSVRQGGIDNTDLGLPNNWGEDVYFAELDSTGWNAPVLMPAPINSRGADFGSAFTGDGQTMVYVRCEDPQGVGSCDLYITTLEGTTWSEPVNMGNIVNSESWESQPTINSDGNRIIFASTRSGGYGGADLYMVEKNHLGDWGIPQNLGSIVNTPLGDNSPYLAADGKTLYFASQGHPGFGGTDIFYSVFENGKWSRPLNIGTPVNSEGDDTNFTISASGLAYFASSRLDEDNFEIFQVELPDHLKPKPTIVIQGIVSNSKTEEPLGTLVIIEDINTGELIAVNKSNETSGEYLIVLPAGRNYSVSANQQGFFFYSTSFDIPKDTSYQEITLDIALEPIEKGTKVVLNNIFFEVGKAELKPISYVELNKAVDLMKDNGTMVIEVGGHTDDRGSDDANQRLSAARAQSVVDYMKLAGIEAERLIAKGYGESQPIADNATADGRAANRRTEFVIVEF